MSGHFASAAVWLFAHPWVWQPGTALLAAVVFFIMLNGKKISPLFPSAMVVCLLGGVLCTLGLPVGATVGAISFDAAGLFPPAVLQIPKEIAIALIAPGIAIGVSTYLEVGRCRLTPG